MIPGAPQVVVCKSSKYIYITNTLTIIIHNSNISHGRNNEDGITSGKSLQIHKEDFISFSYDIINQSDIVVNQTCGVTECQVNAE